MKCIKCKHVFITNAKFCPECGTKQQIKCSSCGSSLDLNARFCSKCGTKVESRQDTAPVSGSKVLANIPLSPLPLDIPYCPISIQEVTAEGPDEDGDICVTVKYTVTNNESKDWDYISTRAQLLSADGQIIEESSDVREETVCAGDNLEQELKFWRVKASTLGLNPEKAHVLLSFTGSTCHQKRIGKITLPETSLTPIAIPSCEIDGLVKLVSGSALKHEPDSDDDSSIEIKSLIQNLTSQQLSEARVVAKVTDKQGREIFEADGYDELRPGSIAVVSGGGYEKVKKLVGASVDLSLRAYLPSSQTLVQSQGMVIIRPEANPQDESDDETNFSSNEYIPGKRVAFEWEMRKGLINIDDIENKETREALKSALSLAKRGKLKEAIRVLPEMTFEFSFYNLDSDPSEYFSDTDGIVFDIEPDNPRHNLAVDVVDDNLILTASIIFDLEVREDVDLDEASDWLSQNGGYSAGLLSGGWSYHGDEGGHIVSIGDKSAMCDGNEFVFSVNHDKSENLKSAIPQQSRNVTAKNISIESSNNHPDFRFLAESLQSKLLNSDINLQKLYVAPNISEKRIKNAIASYAPNLSPNEIIVLIDSTMFGGGSDGLILTDTGLYAKDIMKKPKSIKFSEIKEVEFVPDGKNPSLRVNGLDFLNTSGVPEKSMILFAESLNEAYGEFFSKNAKTN